MLRYFALVKNLGTVFCFLVFHDIIDGPSKTQNPVSDLVESLHVPQSASQNALSLKSLVLE